MSKEDLNLISPDVDETPVNLEKLVGKDTASLEGETKNSTIPAQEETKEEANAASAHKKKAAISPTPKPRSVSRYQNDVTLRGAIVKLVQSKNVTIVTVCTRATMTVSNYPTVIFFGDNGTKAAQFKEGQRVVIKGALQSYDEAKLRKGQSPVLVVGLTIKNEADVPLVTREATDDIDLKPIETVYYNDENLIEIRGQILALECDKNNDITMTVKMVTGGRWSIVKFPYYARNSNFFLKQVYVKQFIRALGTVQTANIPVEPEENVQTKANEVEKATTVRKRAEEQPRLRTRKKQFFILYDVFSVEN